MQTHTDRTNKHTHTHTPPHTCTPIQHKRKRGLQKRGKFVEKLMVVDGEFKKKTQLFSNTNK